MDSNEKEEKEKIRRNLINKDLKDLIIVLIISIFLGVVFGAIGYYINKDTGNVYEIQKGIIFGAVYPLIMSIVLAFSSSKILDVIITCFYIYLATIIPNYVGIIILFIFIFLMILADIYFLKKDRTKQVNNIYENQKQKIAREQMNVKLKKEKISKKNY